MCTRLSIGFHVLREPVYLPRSNQRRKIVRGSRRIIDTAKPDGVQLEANAEPRRCSSN